MNSKPQWAMPTPIRIRATGEVGRLYQICRNYADGYDMLIVRMNDGREVQVMSRDAVWVGHILTYNDVHDCAVQP